jgi:L-xylulokinase
MKRGLFMPKYLMGIDNGVTATKAALYDLEGREIGVYGSKTTTLRPHPGFFERDMNEVWEANIQAISSIIKNIDISADDIVAVATTGHGNGIYLVDEKGKPVYHAIISTDSRAIDYSNKWLADGTFECVLPKTMQAIWPGQPTALLAWLKDHEPEVFKKACWVFMCKDYIRFCLTGEPYAEITDMSGTSLMNVRDVTYDRELLQEFGLEDCEEMLPPLKYSAEICGYVTKEAAERTGLKEGTPVAGGLFDIDACAIATGITSEDQLCIVAGSWCNNQYISKKPVVSKALFMTSLYCIPGYWLMLEGSATSASNLEWFVSEFFVEERKQAEEQETSVYDLCNQLVASTFPEDAQVVFVPFLYGTNAGADVRAKSCFVGLTGWHTRAHVLRAVYEGIVFSHKSHIEKLLPFREIPKTARIAGGAARSPVWLQIFADVLQIPIEVTTGTELGTLGAAICAGVATRQFESFEQAADKMVQVSQTYIPDPAKKELYKKKYATYRKTIETLNPLWESFYRM